MIIQLTTGKNKLVINGTEMQFPLQVNELQQLLGGARHTATKYNHIYTWDAQGMYVYSKNGLEAETLALLFAEERGRQLKYAPVSRFAGDLLIGQTGMHEYYQQNSQKLEKASKYDEGGSFVEEGFRVYYDINDATLHTVEVSVYIPPPPKIYSDKYHYRKIAGKKIEFADFNFKLAVIQVLMYEKKLLQPQFDLYDFVDNYAERKIDVEEEGYEFIPEVTDYFRTLEIDEKYADEITEINQDGGDEIYGNVLRFWDGEDDTFNIQNFEDIRHFKNLRKMSLFYADNLDEIKQQLLEKNIVVE